MAGTRVFPNALELRAVAARTSFKQIDRDHGAAEPKLRPLLLHIRQNLFSSGLNVQALKRACGVRDNSVSTAFGRAIGMPPRPYIEARRLETAERLLRDTALPVHQIGELVGFSSEAVFYRAFRRWRGEAPREFRQRAQAGSEILGSEGLRPEAVQRALRGRASADETEALIAGLTAVARGSLEQLASCSDTTEASCPPAESLWASLRTLGSEAQRQRVRALRHLRTDLAELLFEKSRTEGRHDRSHGVHIAELAVECLYPGGRALDTIDPVELASLRAQAWAWLGNAHRLTADFLEADKAFEVAKRTLPAEAPPEVACGLLELEASLRHFQNRYGESISLLERAEALLESSGSRRRQARIRFQRATVGFDAGNVAGAESNLSEALLLLLKSPDPTLEYMTYQLLTYIYTRVGRFGEAAFLLPAVMSLGQSLDFPKTDLQWISGLVWRGLGDFDRSELQLMQAREAYTSSGDRLSTALITLDLALVFAERGRRQRAMAFCMEAIPLLQAFRQHQELLAAVSMLQRLIAGQLETVEALEEIRNRLEKVRNDPQLRQQG